MSTNNTRIWEATIASNLVKVGVDEFNQDIHREVYFITLTNARGDRYASDWGSYFKYRAFRRLGRVNTYLARGFSPLRSDKWHRYHPVYGSEAYEAYGAAEEIAWEREVERQAENQAELSFHQNGYNDVE